MFQKLRGLKLKTRFLPKEKSVGRTYEGISKAEEVRTYFPWTACLWDASTDANSSHSSSMMMSRCWSEGEPWTSTGRAAEGPDNGASPEGSDDIEVVIGVSSTFLSLLFLFFDSDAREGPLAWTSTVPWKKASKSLLSPSSITLNSPSLKIQTQVRMDTVMPSMRKREDYNLGRTPHGRSPVIDAE